MGFHIFSHEVEKPRAMLWALHPYKGCKKFKKFKQKPRKLGKSALFGASIPGTPGRVESGGPGTATGDPYPGVPGYGPTGHRGARRRSRGAIGGPMGSPPADPSHDHGVTVMAVPADAYGGPIRGGGTHTGPGMAPPDRPMARSGTGFRAVRRGPAGLPIRPNRQFWGRNIVARPSRLIRLRLLFTVLQRYPLVLATRNAAGNWRGRWHRGAVFCSLNVWPMFTVGGIGGPDSAHLMCTQSAPRAA